MIYPIRLLFIPQDYWHLHDLFSTEFTITSSGVPISGETYNLTCTVESNVPPTVQWLYSSNGNEVTNGSGITMGTQRTTGSTTTLTLSFNPLHTYHGGQYTCRSKTDTPPSTVNATRNVTVQGEVYIYTRDAQYMQYLNKNFVNLPEMLTYVKLLAFSFKGFMISKTYIFAQKPCRRQLHKRKNV